MPLRASSNARVPPDAPAPTIQTSGLHSPPETAISTELLALRAGVTRQISATAREGGVADNGPAGGGAIVPLDEIPDRARPEGAHLLSERAEILPRQHPLVSETMASGELDALADLKVREALAC